MSYSMEKNNNLAAPSHIQLPPGFRFHPSDEELIVHYLTNKVASIPLPASIIAEIDLYKYNPWDLPRKALFGEEEWYFFTPRDRKYPNGARPNRAAASGFWKATGTDKPILTSFGRKSIGVKKALVFYEGRPPKGYKTDWIMHEYRLPDTIAWTPKRKGSMRLDDWVLCRVRQKSINSRKAWDDRNGYSYEAAPGFISKVNELRHMNNTNPNVVIRKGSHEGQQRFISLTTHTSHACGHARNTIQDLFTYGLKSSCLLEQGKEITTSSHVADRVENHGILFRFLVCYLRLLSYLN